jgi:hypothetical protein
MFCYTEGAEGQLSPVKKQERSSNLQSCKVCGIVRDRIENAVVLGVEQSQIEIWSTDSQIEFGCVQVGTTVHAQLNFER